MTSHRVYVAVAIVLGAMLSSAARAAVVTVPFKGPRQVEDIRAQGIEILAFTKFGMDLEVDDAQLAWIRSRPYPSTVIVADETLAPAGIAALDANLGQYHTYAETESTLTALAAAYPAIAQKSVAGLSLEGRNLSVLKISDNVTVDEDEPEVLYMGNHHARELMSVEIPLRFAEYLLQNYGIDSDVTTYVDTREIFVLPMVNPDGHVYVELNHGGSPNGWWRKNRRDNGNGTFGVDLNRNYDFAWGYDNIGSSPSTGSEVYRGSAPFSEPETQVIRDFTGAHTFTAWFSYHSYGEVLLYPWGYIYANTPDNEVFAALGDSLTAENGYVAGNPLSGAIYITNGGSDDWGYGEQVTKNKVFAFTPEVNSALQGGFGPPESEIQPTFDLMLPMNLKLLEFADNPYKVVGPHPPTQYATQAPYGNGVTRVSWTAGEPADPNPPTHYEIEACLDPAFFTDTATPALTGWISTGFSYTAGGFSGGGYSSGNDNGISNSLRMERPYIVDASSDTLSFMITYNTEANYDYGYVDISTDDGQSWTPIEGNITTSYNPNGNNRGYGWTGSSGGWVSAVFPLTAYLGQEISIRLAYITDGSVLGTGYRVDNLDPVPTCSSISILASASTDTLYDFVPPAAGTWRFRVHALDADDQPSHWSNARDGVVATLTGADTPRVFRSALGANYPNPFNPATQIPYVVGGGSGGPPARTVVAIYSVTGARVATVVDDERRPGTYTARWNGADDRGRRVSSGIYFARLLVDGSPAATRKLVLLK